MDSIFMILLIGMLAFWFALALIVTIANIKAVKSDSNYKTYHISKGAQEEMHYVRYRSQAWWWILLQFLFGFAIIWIVVTIWAYASTSGEKKSTKANLDYKLMDGWKINGVYDGRLMSMGGAQAVTQTTNTTETNYNSLTKAELMEELDRKGIDYKKSMTKPELIDLLNKK